MPDIDISLTPPPRVIQTVTQNSHGFVVGDVIRVSGTNTYAKAQANSEANSRAVGIVSQVVNANEFVFTSHGKLLSGVPAEAAGTVMFLSASVAGAMTSTAPAIVVPILVVVENAVSAIVLNALQDGVGSVCKTYAEWDVIRLAGELPEGLWVGVTDIPSQPSATFALFCKEVDQFALGGFGTFLNADWQNVGDYSGVFAITGVAFTANVGQWYVGLEGTAVDGDVVIWNCLHYQVIDAASFAGTDPATNTSAYTLLPKATANTGYISEVDDIEFDFPNDWLQYRADKRGNTYRYSQSVDSVFLLGQTGIDFFQWGRDSWYGNSCDNGLIDQINFGGSIFRNCLLVFATIKDNTGVSTSQIHSNNLSSLSRIENNTLGANSVMVNTQLTYGAFIGNTIDPSILFTDNVITGGSLVTDKFFQANYERNTIGVDFTFMESNSTLVLQTMHVPGNSTQIRDLDITGGGSIDIGTNAELVGIYNLTSGNATETITDFVDATWPTLFPFTLKPVAGLIVTINFTSVGSLSASGQIVDGSSFIVLDGDNGDEATMQVQSIGGFDVLVVTEVVQML